MKIHSPEYQNALKDYNFSINNGYFFEKGDIFSSFVYYFYNLRLQYPKDNPMNLITKLIMNSCQKKKYIFFFGVRKIWDASYYF